MLSGTEILTTAQMRAIESAAMASGKVTGLKLMERAGAAVAGHIRLRWPRPGRATVLCGPGNNGGDGYVIARHLARAGWQVRVLGIDNTPGPDAAEMRRQWLALGPILPLTDAELRSGPDCDVYVDAIFGTGLTRPPGREIAAILSCLGGYGGDAAFYRPRLVAVDCPSGLCLDSGAFLGATVFGFAGDEIIATLSNYMATGSSYQIMQQALPVHPTVAEYLPTILAGLTPLETADG